MSDHAQCDERISKALATGHPGFAEYLATRCDLWHRREREQETRDGYNQGGEAS